MSWQLLINPISSLLDKFIPDKDAREKMAHEIATMAENHGHEIAKAQIEVNKQEAAHKSLFVAGARPAILWMCGLAMGYNTIIHPILDIWYEMPAVDVSLLYPVLMGLLGLGGMRTAEKFRGVARER